MNLFGWTLMSIGVVVLLGLLITSGDIRDRTAGTGERRITRRGQLASQRQRIAELEQQIAGCPTCTPPEPGFPTVEEIAASDLTDTAPRMAMRAPADIGAGTPITAAATVRDGFLDSIARPGEEGMLAALKAVAQQPKPQAPPEAVTQTLPAASPVAAVAPLWQVPFGPGSSDPTEVSRITGQRAMAAVDNALGEAS